MKKKLLKASRLSFATAAFMAVTGGVQSQTVVDSLTFTGGMQTYTVPCGVTSITIDCYGAEGAAGATGGNSASGGIGGLGGHSSGTLDVVPGQVLNIFVGGMGATPTGGFNGGANGGSTNAGGGGGATDVRINSTGLADRVIVAGGGGGGGRAGCETSTVAGGNGGAGGGANGVNGFDAPTSSGVAGGGGGGVGTTGGSAGIGCGGFLGAPGTAGTTGNGGTGGAGQSCCCFSFPSIPGGGGGGGGFDGGGGGGGGSAGTAGCSGNDKGAGGGGAGGTNYNGGMTVAGAMDNGVRTGNGAVYISYPDPLPGAADLSAPTTAFCAGDTITYTSIPTANASTFTWTATGDLTILSGQGTDAIMVTSTGTSGTLSVMASNVCGDGPVSTPVTITVNPLPAVTANATETALCAGETTTLTGSGATSYSWDNGATDGVAFAPAATTTYTVTGTDANGCSAMASVMVTVNALPNVALTATQTGTVCGGQDITLTGTPAGGTYSVISGSSSALTGNTFNAPAQGNWTIAYDYTDGNGCSSADTLDFVVDCMLGLEMIGANGTMNVYPNPTSGKFTVSAKSNINGTIEVFNDLGQLVYTQNVKGVNKKQVEIKDLAPGVYNIKITSDNQVFSGKLNITK